MLVISRSSRRILLVFVVLFSPLSGRFSHNHALRGHGHSGKLIIKIFEGLGQPRGE